MSSIRIGKASDNDLILNHQSVSEWHAEIVYKNGDLILVDLESPGGTFIDGASVQGAQVVFCGQELTFGTFKLVLKEGHVTTLIRAAAEAQDGDVAFEATLDASPAEAAKIRAEMALEATLDASSEEAEKLRTEINAPSFNAQLKAISAASVNALEGTSKGDPLKQAVQISLDGITIGAAPDNTIQINARQVSGHHARIFSSNGDYILVDQGSTNGTFLNGTQIYTPVNIRPGDEIGLGSHTITVDNKLLGRLSAGSATQAIDISAALLDFQNKQDAKVCIGRGPKNDIVLTAPQVSTHHVELRREPNGGWQITDLGSTNGTYINSREDRLSPRVETPATEDDVLYLGSYRFPISRVDEFLQRAKIDQDILLPTNQDVVSIGRDNSNDVVLDAPSISRAHAQLRKVDSGWELRDLGSANGTFVNGARIQSQEIWSTDLLSFGNLQIRFDLDTGKVHKEYQGEIMLRAEGVCIDVPDPKAPGGKKRILDNVSFTAYPTEFIGLMGPSGAGKTTLMMALNGYLVPTKGQSLLNNTELYQNYNSFRGNIGYVPQDDIIHQELTVYESLYFTAKLRLPPDTTDAEINALIDRTLSDLGILETRDVLIGSPLKKGISGGQRKRVNLAQELLTQPSLLFLDEPTSGLASSDTRDVMKLLRKLADKGRTILLTIHQPSLEAYREMDNVLYLARGKLMYYGPTHPDSITYFNPDLPPDSPETQKFLNNPDNAMSPLALDNNAPDSHNRLIQRQSDYLTSKYHRDYVDNRRENRDQVQIVSAGKQKSPRKFGFRQWWTLTRRNFTIKRKDTTNLAILLLQAPLIGFLISLVFSQASHAVDGEGSLAPFNTFLSNQSSDGINAAALFMLAATSVWFGTSNAAREIVGEQAIYRRERMVNLKILSYVMSKFTVLATLSLVQCTMMLAISYPILGFHGSFIEMLISLVLCSTAGLGIGLLLSSIVRSTEAAVALVPLLLIPQLLLGGLIVPISDFEGGALKPVIRYSSNLMVARWGFEGLLHTEEDSAPAHETIPSATPNKEISLDDEDGGLEKILSDNLPSLTPKEVKAGETFWNKPFNHKPSLIKRKGQSIVKPENKSRIEAYIRYQISSKTKDLRIQITEKTASQKVKFQKDIDDQREKLSDDLNKRQSEEKITERYFGPFKTSFANSILVLILFNLLMLALVAMLLKRKDLKVT